MASIWFTGNYQDLSTDRGYQFKFRCEKCGNGYLSTFKVSTLGMASSAMRAAGNLFGGLLGNAANSAYEIQRAVGSSAHDAALKLEHGRRDRVEIRLALQWQAMGVFSGL